MRVWFGSDDAKLHIFLDGITVQKAADILLGDYTTTEDRRLCGISYLRSLEDFTLAIIAADRLVVNVRMPAYVKGVHPGRDLIENFFNEKVIYVGQAGEFSRNISLMNRRDRYLHSFLCCRATIIISSYGKNL